MVYRMTALALALTLNATLACAQDAVLTVTVPSADVHKGPSTGTPIVGHASRGTILPVSRNLGSWARVPWPEAPEGVGYVHLTMGRLGASRADVALGGNRAARPSSAPVSVTPAVVSGAVTTTPPAPRTPTRERMAVQGGPTDAPITHILGIGGLVASRSSYGAAARAWPTDHIGIQLAVARDAATSDLAGGRMTSIRVEPGVVLALFDHVSDYVWIRPYVGSGMSFRRQTLKVAAPELMERTSDNGIGLRVFGGSELTFAGMPRFGLSAEVGYGRFATPFPAFAADRVSVAIAGHWYVK